MFGGCLEKFLKDTLGGNQGVYLKRILDFEIELSNVAGYFRGEVRTWRHV